MVQHLSLLDRKIGSTQRCSKVCIGIEVDNVLIGEPARSSRWQEEDSRRRSKLIHVVIPRFRDPGFKVEPTQTLTTGWWYQIEKSAWTSYIQNCLQKHRIHHEIAMQKWEKLVWEIFTESTHRIWCNFLNISCSISCLFHSGFVPWLSVASWVNDGVVQ